MGPAKITFLKTYPIYTMCGLKNSVILQ